MAIASIDLTNVPDNLNQRAFLRAVGFDVKDRGRLSADQQSAIDVATKQGYQFEAAAPVAEKVEALVSQSDISLLEFREWQLSKGRKPHSKGRISQVELNEYVTDVPDFVKREVEDKPVKVRGEKVELKPLPKVDAKLVKEYADANNLEYPSRGRLPRWLIERYLNAHDEAGTVAPEPVEENVYRPAAERINLADFYEGYEFDYDDNGDVVIGKRVNNDKGHALCKKSWRDCDVKTGYSIGVVPGHSFAFDPRDTDNELILLPAK